jgi:hypothetical protein
MQRNAPICCKIYFNCRPYLRKETQTDRFLGCLLRHLGVFTLLLLRKNCDCSLDCYVGKV